MEPSVPDIVMGVGPTSAPAATLTTSAAEAVPPDGTLIGLGVKLEKLAPGGELVTASATAPEYPVIDVPVIVTLPELPSAMETIPEGVLRPKSGVMAVILAILFVPDSMTHVLPDESTITSFG
jgi:hypothetical protein